MSGTNEFTIQMSTPTGGAQGWTKIQSKIARENLGKNPAMQYGTIPKMSGSPVMLNRLWSVVYGTVPSRTSATT